ERGTEVGPECVPLESVEGQGISIVLILGRGEVVQARRAAVDGQAVLLIPLGARPAAGAFRGRVGTLPPRIVRDALAGRIAALVAAAPPGVAQEVLDVQVIDAVGAERAHPARALRDVGRPSWRAAHAPLR